MKFEDVLPALREGKPVRRKAWQPEKNIRIHNHYHVLISGWSELDSSFGEWLIGNKDDWEVVEEEPLPCPFCGAKSEYDEWSHRVRCSNYTLCDSMGPSFFKDRETTIALWNKARRP
jgi:hypothetical protein